MFGVSKLRHVMPVESSVVPPGDGRLLILPNSQVVPCQTLRHAKINNCLLDLSTQLIQNRTPQNAEIGVDRKFLTRKHSAEV
jgi:hypothetical protein